MKEDKIYAVLNVRMTKEIHRSLKSHAANIEKSMNEIIIKLIKDYLSIS